MRYCVYLLWRNSRIEAVQEFFHTEEEAQAFAQEFRKDDRYEVHVGPGG